MYQLRGKNLADSVAICGQGRELFRSPMYNAQLRFYEKEMMLKLTVEN